MAKISELPYLATPTGKETVVVESDGVTRQASLRTLIEGDVVRRQLQSLVDTQSIVYFIDPVTGSDAADGRTAATAWRSPAPVVALGAAIAGKPIGLARGSVLRSPIALVAERVRIRPFGDPALAAPVIDCSIDLPNWTPVAGQAGRWTANAVLFDDAKNLGNVFRDDVAVPLFFTVAEFGVADYAAQVSVWSNADGNPHQTGTAATITIRSVTNPNSDGSRWRIANAYGIHVTGAGALVEGVRVERAAHQDGGIALGERATVRGVVSGRTSRHAMLVGLDATIEDCALGVGSANPLEGGLLDGLVVFSGGAVGGRSFSTARNVFYQSIDAHGAAAVDTRFGLVTHTDDVWAASATSCVSAFSSDHRVVRPTFRGAGSFYATGGAGARMRITGAGENGPSRLTRMCDLAKDEIFASVRNTITVPLLNGWFYGARAPTGAVTMTVDGDTITIEAAADTTPESAVFFVQKGTLDVRNLTVSQRGGRMLGSPASLMMYVGFGGDLTLSGGKNSWPFGSRFSIKGVEYKTLAAAQAAGYEVGSITQQPKAPTYTDTFDRADQPLETAGAGWSVLAGVAASAGVRSGKLAVIRNDARSAYAAGQMASTDGYVRFTSAAAEWAETMVAIGITDLNNYIGLRANAGRWSVFTCANGDFRKLFDAGSPAVGQDVIFERCGTRIRVYVDGEIIGQATADNAAYNAVKTFGLVTWQGLYTILDNLRAGDL